uniref:Uncharacterized protein n=1 Tax=viral metagenome TaxID=1070528 RepID=A0A6M3M6F1_9ZZZZ
MSNSEIVEKVLEMEMRLKRQEELMERVLGILEGFCDNMVKTYNVKEKTDGEG